MISHFFIDRPIFATVLSIVIVIVGGVALLELPIAQYPEVAPPTVNVTATYPGANAKTVAETVATPIEQEVNGVERMLYMSSRCTNDGQMTMDVTFELGTNLDQAQVFVQNRVSIAEAKLPEEVKRQGVTTKKKSPSILLCVNLISPDGRYDQLYLSNFATINIKDNLSRIKGVGDVTFLGPRDYSMRIWLDPKRLAARYMTAGDVIKAIKEQNVQVAAGRLGQPPLPGNETVPFQLVINAQGRLESEEKFGNILVKTGSQGQLVFLRDVVRDTVVGVNLDPTKLTARGMAPDPVAAALKEGCRRVEFQPFGAAAPPADKKLQLKLTNPPSNVGDFVIKVDEQKRRITLRDLVQESEGIIYLERGVELGAKNYDVNSYLDGRPSVTMAVFQLPGSNALETARNIREEMERLKAAFPQGVEYRIVYDTTVFIDESIHEVYKTLFEAIVLVFLVVLVFLQNWRATIIPMIAVPVSLIGTFAIMAMLGFSLNNLSLFGLVLAIGIVVDDAIVVVENVERWLAMGLSPRDASRKAMDEVTGPVVGIALVLCAVFIPTAFMAGISGQFFRQFGLTIAASTVISAFNSLTLSPALCALMLKPHGHGEHGHGHQEALPRLGIVLLGGLAAYFLLTPYAAQLVGIHLPAAEHGAPSDLAAAPSSPAAIWGLRAGVFLAGAIVGWLAAQIVNRALGAFFQGFNWAFERTINGYGFVVGMFLRLSVIMLAIYGGLIGLTYLGFRAVPVGFIPEQDKGYLVVNAQLPDGASLDRSDRVIAEMTRIALGDKNDPTRYPGIDGVDHVISVPGYSILLSTNISNVGGMFVILKPFEERKGKPGVSGPEIAAELRKKYSELQQARVVIFSAPAVDGLGSAGGFKLQVQDRRGAGLRALEGSVQEVATEGNQDPKLSGLFSSFSVNQPQLYVDIDREKAKAMNVSLDDIHQTLQAYLGSTYVNDITLFNRNWQVYVQSDSRYRLRVEDIGKLETRNAEGQRVPLQGLITVKDTSGPAIVNHYNLYPSAEINGNTAPGISSGQAITIMDKLCADQLPQTMGFEWTELTYQQILAAKDLLTKLVFPLAVIFVFLTLSAMYESWSLPLAIILIVPMCLLAAIAGVWLVRLDNNIFTQIGLVVLVGLAAKNAILIVEFAKQLQDQGKARFEATIEACRLRLRPILMTSFAFILGVVPLVLAKGAGAEMRFALGIAVFSGMLGVTIFGIFFTPVFYSVIRWFAERGTPPPSARKEPIAGHDAAPPTKDGPAASSAAQSAHQVS
jgi:multidrug efflux pump